MPQRGELTPRVRAEMEKFFGRPTDFCELRLIPYIQYVMVNEQEITPEKINRVEREILVKWSEAGHIVGGMAGLAVTVDFWNFMCNILLMAYVNYRDEPVDP